MRVSVTFQDNSRLTATISGREAEIESLQRQKDQLLNASSEAAEASQSGEQATSTILGLFLLVQHTAISLDTFKQRTIFFSAEHYCCRSFCIRSVPCD